VTRSHFIKRCDNCGAQIVMAKDGNGKWWALDEDWKAEARFLFTLDTMDPDGVAVRIAKDAKPPRGEVYGAHFENCNVGPARRGGGGVVL